MDDEANRRSSKAGSSRSVCDAERPCRTVGASGGKIGSRIPNIKNACVARAFFLGIQGFLLACAHFVLSLWQLSGNLFLKNALKDLKKRPSNRKAFCNYLLFKPRHGAGGGAVAIAELQRETGKIEKAIAALVQIAEVFYIDNVAGGKEPPVAGEIYV